MGHFLTLQFLQTLKKMDLKMALIAPKLFIWSANIPNCQMQWYKKKATWNLSTADFIDFCYVLSDKTNGDTQLNTHTKNALGEINPRNKQTATFFFYCCTVHSEIHNCSLTNKCTTY
jgi:hypothetical protein